MPANYLPGGVDVDYARWEGVLPLVEGGLARAFVPSVRGRIAPCVDAVTTPHISIWRGIGRTEGVPNPSSSLSTVSTTN